MRASIRLVLLLSLSVCSTAISDETEKRPYWFFQPVLRPKVPVSANADKTPTDSFWSTDGNEIDAFVERKLREKGLEFSPSADRRTVARRLYFDLTGLPPSPEEIDRFRTDVQPRAYERLVDRLLASPRYGERWARYWLDLVRYADSDGFRADEYRPHAWKYRDWVVRSFNADKPYDRFVAEQIAGDELFPDSPDATLATGFLRHWPYEHNQRDIHRHRDEILNDITDVTGEALLGISLRCARCHDHKFDEDLLQRDYFGLRAFFEAILPRNDLVAASTAEREKYKRQEAIWLEATKAIRAEMAKVEAPTRRQLEKPAIEKFSKAYQKILATPYEKLSPLDRQIHFLASLQLQRETRSIETKLKGEAKKRWDVLRAKLREFDKIKPKKLQAALTVVEVGKVAPPTQIPQGDQVAPSFLSVFQQDAPDVRPTQTTTGRRSALARWMTSRDNPLTHRVIVNRVWQHHFGRGLVSTPNDFGKQGQRPTHPELLDWLTSEFTDSGMQLKHLHRLIVTSKTYRQIATVSPESASMRIDPENLFLSRMTTRRLSAETLRDATLATSGELESKLGGSGVSESSRRRSIYSKVLRNKPGALMNAFDGPDNFNSCGLREVTTTAPQALLLLNGKWYQDRARSLARRATERSSPNDRSFVDQLFLLTLSREPTEAERQGSLEFLSTGSDALSARFDLSHLLLNTNEFLYVD